MWNELKEVVEAAMEETAKAAMEELKERTTSDVAKILDETRLPQMLNVIKLMIAARDASADTKDHMTEKAFAALHVLNTDLGGFKRNGDYIAKAAKHQSEKIVAKYAFLKVIRPLIEKLIAFFYYLKLASLNPEAERSYSLFQEKKKAATTIIQKVARGKIGRKVAANEKKIIEAIEKHIRMVEDNARDASPTNAIESVEKVARKMVEDNFPETLAFVQNTSGIKNDASQENTLDSLTQAGTDIFKAAAEIGLFGLKAMGIVRPKR